MITRGKNGVFLHVTEVLKSGVYMQVRSHPVICFIAGVAESKPCYYTPRWWQPPLPCFNIDRINSFSSSFSNRSIEIVVCAWCEGLLANIIEMTVWKGIQQLSPSYFHVLLPDMQRALHCLEWEHLYSVESTGVGWCPMRSFCCIVWLSELFFCFITAKCIYGGKVLAEGQRILTKSCRECRVSFSLMIPITCREGDAGFR